MVAYSYQPQFIDPTLSGRKIHTIRQQGKRRHARPDEALQHYTAMRTKHCRLFARSTCLKTLGIEIHFAEDPLDDAVELSVGMIPGLELFAQQDGFTGWSALRAFWEKTHGPLKFDAFKVRVFSGVIIYWKDMQPA